MQELEEYLLILIQKAKKALRRSRFRLNLIRDENIFQTFVNKKFSFCCCHSWVAAANDPFWFSLKYFLRFSFHFLPQSQ